MFVTRHPFIESLKGAATAERVLVTSEPARPALRRTAWSAVVAGAPVVENLHRFLVFSFATSLGWDMGRALTNIVLITLTGSVVLRTLRRAARKAAFEAPVEFTGPVSPGTPPS